MWGTHHTSSDGDEAEASAQNSMNDPAARLAVSALAAFAQQGSTNPGYNSSVYGTGGNAPPYHHESNLYQGPQALHQQQQQALLAYQQGNVAPPYAAPNEIEYARRLAAHRSMPVQYWGSENVPFEHPRERSTSRGSYEHAPATMASHSYMYHPVMTKPSSSLPEEAATRYPPEETATRYPSASSYGQSRPSENPDNGNDEAMSEEDEAVEEEEETSPIPTPVSSVAKPAPRGKPEAMAMAYAAKRIEAERQELAGEKQSDEDDDDEEEEEDDSDDATGEVTAEPVEAARERTNDSSGGVLAATSAAASVASTEIKPVKKPRKRTSEKGVTRTEHLLHERVPPITEVEYKNLEALMMQMCRVPLLSEFSRPVALLHAELAESYAKIVAHPVDLGHVCRGIRRLDYQSLRDVRLDMWRVFANCVKFHSHPNNKEAVPTFVSIALHLRDFFNGLWQEYMMPSDPPENANQIQKRAFEAREKDRRHRLLGSGVLVLVPSFLQRAAQSLGAFIDRGGVVDQLDKTSLWGADTTDPALGTVIENLRRVQHRLACITVDVEGENTLAYIAAELKMCYAADEQGGETALTANHLMRQRVANRCERWLGKLAVPLHEANSRGVTQSSIWGNIATTIWARESSKKPYWPALCLGILPPEEQREYWHTAVTERNESRLPEKLRTQLMLAKKKCEQAQKRQSLSFFLVEFLGTHEFIWVRETDIVENWDRNEDPNKAPPSPSKKKRSSRGGTSSVIGSKTYALALDECQWALEEFDGVIAEAFEETAEVSTEETEEENYSFSLLKASDDEASEEDGHGFQYDETDMSVSDVDESNWLLSHDGMLDASAAGRKNAKRRTALKKKADRDKKPAEADKRVKTPEIKKKKTDLLSKVQDEKREQKELERRRKKRVKERERALQNDVRKGKGRQPSMSNGSDDEEKGILREKRMRASAIVSSYVNRMAKNDEFSKTMALNSAMANLPAAMVDPVSLLGMTLAFRATAGELKMPDDNGEQEKMLKPWLAIDVDKPKTSADRVTNLKQRIEIIQREIAKVKEHTKRRKELTEEAVLRRKMLDLDIEADEEAARQNIFKKKKKGSPKQSSKPNDDSFEKSETRETEPDDENEDEAEVVDAEAEELMGTVSPMIHDSRKESFEERQPVEAEATESAMKAVADVMQEE